MRKINDPFYSEYPTIDLHGEDRVGAIIRTRELIEDSIKLKYNGIVIIHGKGSGIVRESVHETLKNDKRIESFKTDNFNDGMTVAYIKEDYMKKGFTLVEVLAVIVLIGAVMLLIVPNVTGSFKNSQKNIFYNDVVSLYSNATTTYLYNVTINHSASKVFCKDLDSNTNLINADDDDELYYYVRVNSSGKVEEMTVANDKFKYTMPSTVNEKNDISKNDIIEDTSKLSCD